MAKGYLVSLSTSLQLSEYRLSQSTSLGRDPDKVDLVLTEPTVSREHLRIDVFDDGAGNVEFQLIDLNSSNGVYLNQQKVTTAALKPGDFIGVGRAQPHLLFSLESQGRHEYEFALGQAKKFRIGRASAMDISLLSDPGVSADHAEVVIKNQQVYLADRNSLNGTWVNGARIKRTKKISLADVVNIGSYQLSFILRDQTLQVVCNNLHQNIHLEAIALKKTVSVRGVKKDILSEINLSINSGEFVGILGPSGAGKTNLLKTLAGQQPPSSGCVLFNEVPVYRNQDVFRNSTGYVPQDDIIHTQLTVKDCLAYVGKLRLPDDLDDQQRENLINNQLAKLRLDHVQNNLISELSGGQRKRVSIGTELMTRPSLLFLDEPTSGLDPSTEEKIMHQFKKMTDQGSTVIITTHILYNLALLDKVIIMARGRLVFFGPPCEALAFFSDSAAPLESAVTIFDELEAETDSAKGLLSAKSAVPAQQQLASHYADKFKNSPSYDNHIAAKLGGMAQSMLSDASDKTADSVSTLELLRQPVKHQFQWPGFLSLGRVLTLCMRNLSIKFASKARLGLYLLAPLIFGLIVVSLGTNEIPELTEISQRKSEIHAVINPAQFSIAAQIKLLFSPLGIEEPKSATDLVYAMLNEGVASFTIPMSALIMLVMSALFMGTLIACLEISTERTIFEREFRINVGAFEYLSSKMPYLLSMTTVQVALMLAVCLINSGFHHADLLSMFIILTLVAWVAVAMGLFVSALDPSNGQFSVVIALIIVLPQLILSGALGPDFFLEMNMISKSLAQLLPAKWGLEMLITAAHDAASHPALTWMPEYTDKTIGFNFGQQIYLYSGMILVVQTVFWLLMSYLALRQSVKLK